MIPNMTLALRRMISLLVIVAFCLISLSSDLAYAADAGRQSLVLPVPTQMIKTSGAFSYPVLKGLKIDPQNPLNLRFIIDTQDTKMVNEDEARKLVNYFFTAVAVPQKDLWGNLSPYEKDRVVTDELGQTVLGEELLAQDYLLKQLSSSLTDPNTATGKDYWKSAVQSETFKKIWIKPETAHVYENGNQVFVTQATLDIESEASAGSDTELLLPTIKKEVNEGEHFASIRQAYYSIILGLWFKEKLKTSIFKNYIDQKQVNGIAPSNPRSKEEIFNAYVESFKKGVYNLNAKTRENGRLVKKAYFSGGAVFDGFTPQKVGSSSLKLGDDLYSFSVEIAKAQERGVTSSPMSSLRVELLTSLLSRRQEKSDSVPDTIMICGNDNIGLFEMIVTKYGNSERTFIISGGQGRLTGPLLDAAEKKYKIGRQFFWLEKTDDGKDVYRSEAYIIKTIMQKIAKRQNKKLEDDQFILEENSTNTDENFAKTAVKFKAEGISDRTIMFFQTPHQQLRTISAYTKNQEAFKELKIAMIPASYPSMRFSTVPVSSYALVTELWRLAMYPTYGFSGPSLTGQYWTEKGVIDEIYWDSAGFVYRGLSDHEKREFIRWVREEFSRLPCVKVWGAIADSSAAASGFTDRFVKWHMEQKGDNGVSPAARDFISAVMSDVSAELSSSAVTPTGGVDLMHIALGSSGVTSIELNANGIDPTMFKGGISFAIMGLDRVSSKTVLAGVR